MATLLDEGLLLGGYDVAGDLQVIFLDPLPAMDKMRVLGITPVPGYGEALNAASTEELDDSPVAD